MSLVKHRVMPGVLGGSGMVALWGASSLIASVQRGTITIATGSTSNTATITSVDTTRAIVTYGGEQYQNSVDQRNYVDCHVVLTNGTTVTVTRNNSGGAGTATPAIAYEVIEFMPGVLRSLQRGTITCGGAQASNTATITAVNTATSIIINGRSLTSSGGDNTSEMGTIVLTNGTTVTLARNGSTAGLTAPYQVMEFY